MRRIVFLIPLLLAVTACATPGDTSMPMPTLTPLIIPTDTPVPAGTLTSAATAAPGVAQFGDGTWQVGKDIMAGTYRTRVASPGCYFARLSGFGGTLGEIIANENADFPWVVTIAASDKGFESDDCGTWTADLSAITSSRTSFDDGVYIVGTDITAGTYKSAGEAGCYWARLSGFGDTNNQIIANDNTDTPAIVTIAAKDKGFESKGCGTWTRQ
jgi:hypothetical protein